MDTLLELRGVTRRFGAHAAVDEVSLSLDRGQLFSLVGPSGCGKTTLLRLVAGFEPPDAGEILLDGVAITHLPPYERNVSTVFQNYALFPHLTVAGNIGFGLRRRSATGIDARVREMLELVRLSGKESRQPSELSGGEKQRVALARSLAIAPGVLLLDEPLSALDPNLRQQVRAEVKSLQRRTGVTFLMVTHDREEALSLSDRLAVMNQGRIEQAGTPEEVYRRPRTKFAAEFLGPVNWIGNVGVRPESLRPGGGRVSARVRDCQYLGNRFQVTAQCADGNILTAELREALPPNEAIRFDWSEEDEIRL